MANIVFSPALQAPITLSNPTGSLILASDPGGSVHQANPIPGQYALSLVGAAVRLALSMTTNTSALSLISVAPSVIQRGVTPQTPNVGVVTTNGIAPVITTGGTNNFAPDPWVYD